MHENKLYKDYNGLGHHALFNYEETVVSARDIYRGGHRNTFTSIALKWDLLSKAGSKELQVLIALSYPCLLNAERIDSDLLMDL